MIIKNNKKCNIKINDKQQHDLFFTFPELKKFKEKGIMIDSISSYGDCISIEFRTIFRNLSYIEGIINILLEEEKKYTKNDILKLLDLNLRGLYIENNK